jgi:hypothetical protein
MGQLKIPSKKTQSKWLGLKRLVQNGILAKLDKGHKNYTGGWLKFLVKKFMIPYNEWPRSMRSKNHIYKGVWKVFLPIPWALQFL